MIIASMFSNFHQVGLSTVSSEVAHSLNANSAHLGILAAAFAYPYALMQIPAGLLSDTLGSRKSVSIALLLAGIGTFIFANANNIEIAILGRVLIGVGIAVIAVPLMKLTAVWFSPESFGKMTALSFTIGGFGLFLATSPMVYISDLIGWQNTYYLLALFTILWAFIESFLQIRIQELMALENKD